MLRKLFILVLLVLCTATPARAQGSRKDDLVLNARGLPMAGATIRVCTAAATGQPCTPLANIFSDPALTQALANPTATDGLGNYSFYAAPGRYMIEISGTGITTKQLPNVILPSDPTAPVFITITTGSISAINLTLSGNLTVSGSTSVQGNLTLTNQATPPGAPGTGTVSLYTKSADKKLYYKDDAGLETGPVTAGGTFATGDGVQYVSTAGNDASSGLSGSTAKANISAAITALPAAGGTVNVGAGNYTFGDIWTAVTKNVLVVMGPGTYTVTATTTVPPNVTLQFQQGTVWSVNTGVTVTIQNPIVAPPNKIFTLVGTGKVVFAGPGNSIGKSFTVSPYWWGATPDLTDSTTAVTNALASLTVGGTMRIDGVVTTGAVTVPVVGSWIRIEVNGTW